MILRDLMDARREELARAAQNLDELPIDRKVGNPPDFSADEAAAVVSATAHPKASDGLPGAAQIVALAVLVEDLRARVAGLEAKS